METGMADVDGAKLYYELSGQGHPLVLLHAGGMDSRMWDDQFELFAGHFKVIRYDARGVGKSEVPTGPFSHYEDLYGLLRFLGIDVAFIVGLSLGGRTAIDFSLAYPQMADALVLVGSGLSGYTFSPQYQEKIMAVVSAVRAGTISQQVEAFLDNSSSVLSPEHAFARQKIIKMLTDNAKASSLDPSLVRELNPPAIEALRNSGTYFNSRR